MYEKLKEILAGKLMVPPDLITMEATPEDIELDSLAVVELSLVLDKELGIELSDDVLAEASTVGDIVRLMEERGATL
ncbi:acyl carrier protein [Streptomyces boncukensis]|uniref:Acyl carrier protein n=1 Tax=Streptomyces boncukensis TaxID=2711219 RepID=A0A6G4WNK9_9ACTN|nr:phosphopantetheine-binding protein [Streptomyces boncukensis]NGO66856.1 acyl carrier protein [Streptomyces boncukensis]